MRSLVRWRGQLSTKFLVLGICLLLLAMLSIGLTMSITWQLDGGAAAVNEAGRMRMQTWRLASAVQGGRDAAQVEQLLREFDQSLTVLREGDPHRPLFVPWNEQTREQYQKLSAAWYELRPLWQQTGAVDAAGLTRQADAFVAQVDGLVSAIENTMARLTAVLNLFQMVMMALAVAGAVLSLYVGYLFVIHPLQRLHQALRQVEAGDFSARVDADAPDEFGDLAVGFNHMVATLQSMYQGLEAKVQEKTRDLEAKGERLAALYEVTSFLVQPCSLEELAQGFAQKVRRLSGADAVAVRWSDDATQRYLLLGSDCLPHDMKEQEQCLEVGSCACGQPAQLAHTQVIPIVPEQPGLKLCVQAGYSTLISVPIRSQQRLLGELDLFYRRDTGLQEEERALYDALAGHLANAIENLRTEALEREAAVSEERTMLARELHDSIAQSLAFLKIQISLLRVALARGNADDLNRIIEELDTGVRESIGDVRELLVHFRTRTNSDDIEQALHTTLRKFEHQSGIQAQLELHGHGVSLPPDVQLQVLHVVQEALSNVRKHAQASEVTLKVERGPHWRFVLRDNGRGFLPQNGAADDTHVGLHIMRERAQRIGAEVRVVSTPGVGTLVELDLPV